MKRLLLILFVLFCCVHIINAQERINCEQAWKIVQDSVIQDKHNVEVFRTKAVLPAGSSIKTVYGTEMSPSFDSWFFFVDDSPLQSWGHLCRYVFVNANDGRIKTFSKNMPPFVDNMEKVLWTTVTADTQTFDVRSLSTSNRTSTAVSHDYAVIISGGMDAEQNFERYWNDCSAIYCALRQKYGYPKDHIFVLMSDGTDSGADRRLNNGQLVSSSLDLDGDGNDDVQYAATYKNVVDVFNILAGRVTENDDLFIFTTDHGGQTSGRDVYMCLWKEIMSDKQFSEQVSKVKAKRINICMGQCYSGGFIDDLQAPNRVIATACDYDQFSFCMSDYQYEEYIYHWISAVWGQTPQGKKVNADFNNDGFVSMQEAFEYAKANDTQMETPQYFSSAQKVGYNLPLSQSVIPLSGPSVVCDSAIYFVENLPKDAEVKWSFKNEAGAYTLSQNDNDCIIKRVGGMIFRGALKVEVSRDNILIVSHSKNLYGKIPFSGTFEQKSEYVNNVMHPAIPETKIVKGNVYHVYQGTQVVLKSKYGFEGLKISHTGVTPSFWQYNGKDQVIFTLPVGSAGIPFHVVGTGDEGSCADFDLLFFSLPIRSNQLAMKVRNDDSTIKIAIEKNEEFASLENTSKVETAQWTLEAYDVYNGKKVFATSIDGKNYCELSTENWKKGIYVLRALINNQVLSEKISIK